MLKCIHIKVKKELNYFEKIKWTIKARDPMVGLDCSIYNSRHQLVIPCPNSLYDLVSDFPFNLRWDGCFCPESIDDLA